eukprot:CAMPEP_0184398268 /NCGR_PEP_ID=MMETSP0007-20130409/64811_1 /TAXON_ID=97485 /ORGANISM="Prymnesium parvum, Strain Texoma1" /LENGTH=33 /DNA_ID= /DNA_START= /DNA_END= /DNA_ORIENTATION=
MAPMQSYESLLYAKTRNKASGLGCQFRMRPQQA